MNQTLNQDRNSGFKKKIIATAVASALLGGNHFAQAQTDGTIEEVVVTGIRASLQRSMDIKRSSQGVVDAISAEDIGKFPDTNLAESLQRITGVSIDRQNGEGSKVSIRGFGPDYNLVTLNGRQMPGASIEATSVSGSRSFDFSNLAAETVSGVEVYKTVRAATPAGGVGGTVNIKTARPLDKPGMQLAASVKGVIDESSQDSSITPEVSGLYSQTFADDKFGVGVSLSYQDREGGGANAQIGQGYRFFPATSGDWGAIGGDLNKSVNHVNPPTCEEIYGVPQQACYGFSEYERTRTNGQLVFQFAPNENIKSTLDYTYSKKEESSYYSDVGAWFNFGARKTIWAEGGEVVSPLLYLETGQGGADLTFGSGFNSQLNENKSIGLNVEWTVTDSLKLEFDAHNSEAESGPDSPYGTNNIITTSAYVRDSSGIVLGGDMPVLLVGTVGGAPVTVDDLQISGSAYRMGRMLHEIDQYQLSGNFEFDEVMNLDFGVSSLSQSNTSQYSNNQRDTWSGLGTPGDVPQDSYRVESIGKYFDGVNKSNVSALSAQAQTIGIPNLESLVVTQRFIADFRAATDYAAANLDDGGGFANCANGSTYYCMNPNPDELRYIEEDSTSAFVQLNVETERVRLAAGIRYEETDVVSFGTDITQQYTGELAWIGANEMYLLTTDDFDITPQKQGEGGYDYFLPSIDFAFDITDDVVLRTSFGRSLGRPLWNQLSGLSISRFVRPAGDGGSANRGNPELLPILSDNFDLSVEWYYGDSSYVSVGYYRKDVENFIGTRSVTEVLFDAPTPIGGARYQAAIDAGVPSWDAAGLKNWIAENATEGVDDSKFPTWVLGVAGDPNLQFVVTEYVNQDDAQFDGLEFAVQHTFGESGFGLLANYTMSEGDTEFDNAFLGAQAALTGLSDTANFGAFYDKDGLQVRLSYNWRDDFLAGTADGTGGNPTYVENYSQFDINASYDVTDNITVFVEGINVTDEYGRNYGRTNGYTKGVFVGGPRYNIGARYTF